MMGWVAVGAGLVGLLSLLVKSFIPHEAALIILTVISFVIGIAIITGKCQ